MDIQCAFCFKSLFWVDFIEEKPPPVYCSPTCYQFKAREAYLEADTFLKPRVWDGATVPKGNILELDHSIADIT